MTTHACPNCGASLSGESGFGMVMCSSCGQLVMMEEGGAASTPSVVPSEGDVSKTVGEGYAGLNLSEDSEGVSPAASAYEIQAFPPEEPQSVSPKHDEPKPSGIFKEVVDFGNQDQPSSGFGALVYDIEIQGIDTAELREEIMSCLSDRRLQLDMSRITNEIDQGLLKLPPLNPVKASVILSRLRHLPLKIKWLSRQLVKESTTFVLAFLIAFIAIAQFASFARAGDWAHHEASLKSYAGKILALQRDLKELIVKKDQNKDPAIRDKLLEQIKTKNDELQKVYQNFREEKEHVLYEHPEQGDTTERKYRHIKLRSADEMESDMGMDEKLDHLKRKVELTYPAAKATPP